MKNILIALIILIGFDQASALKKILKLKIEKKIQPYLGDYYNDDWEKVHAPFSNLIDDYYGNVGSIGKKFEEMMGNESEKQSFLNGKIEYSKVYDWSFEKNPLLSVYQGKKWNK